MSENWDQDYNVSTLSPEQLQQAQNIEWRERQREMEEASRIRDASRGYIQIPALSEQEVRGNFATLDRPDPDQGYQRNGVFAQWHANKMIWICHKCGAFGYKYTLRETFRCYAYQCHSRDITVCRAGELSMFIRGLLHRDPGVNMTDVYQARRDRIRTGRRS